MEGQLVASEVVVHHLARRDLDSKCFVRCADPGKLRIPIVPTATEGKGTQLYQFVLRTELHDLRASALIQPCPHSMKVARRGPQVEIGTSTALRCADQRRLLQA